MQSVPVGDKEWKKKKRDFFLFSRNKKSSGQISPCDKCSLEPPPCSPCLFSVKRGGGVRGGPWGLKDVPPQLDLGGDPWLCWTFSRCEVPSIYLRLSFLSPSLSLPVRRCWPGSAASVEIYQSPGEYRMPLSKNSDPAVLDRRLNASPILSLEIRREEGGGGGAERDGGRKIDLRGDLDDLALLSSADLLHSRAFIQTVWRDKDERTETEWIYCRLSRDTCD